MDFIKIAFNKLAQLFLSLIFISGYALAGDSALDDSVGDSLQLAVVSYDNKPNFSQAINVHDEALPSSIQGSSAEEQNQPFIYNLTANFIDNVPAPITLAILGLFLIVAGRMVKKA